MKYVVFGIVLLNWNENLQTSWPVALVDKTGNPLLMLAFTCNRNLATLD